MGFAAERCCSACAQTRSKPCISARSSRLRCYMLTYLRSDGCITVRSLASFSEIDSTKVTVATKFTRLSTLRFHELSLVISTRRSHCEPFQLRTKNPT